MTTSDSHGAPWSGRTLSSSVGDGDDGSVPAGLVEALTAGDVPGVVTALLAVRVLVAVVATLEASEPGPDGHLVDKAAHMSVVTIRGADGRLALPVFSSTDSLAAWDPSVRPVPVDGMRAALAALDEGADALLVDPAGPSRVVVEGAAMRALAEGRVPVPPAADRDVVSAVEAAVTAARVPVKAVRLRQGDTADVVVELLLAAGTSDDDAARAGIEVGQALAADPVLRARLVRGLDLAVVREQQESGS